MSASLDKEPEEQGSGHSSFALAGRIRDNGKSNTAGRTGRCDGHGGGGTRRKTPSTRQFTYNDVLGGEGLVPLRSVSSMC